MTANTTSTTTMASSTTMTPSSGNNKNNNVDFKGGYLLMKEIQRNISFRAYEEVCGMGDSKSLKQLYDLVFEKYHGAGPDGFGLAEKFMKGIEMFEGIYEDKVDEVTGNHERVLKTVLHCKSNVKIISDPDERIGGINMITLTASSLRKRDTLLQGRQIWEMGKQVEENGRKVLAILCRSKYKEGTVASGEGWEDYMKYCRYKMKKLSDEKEGEKRKKQRMTQAAAASSESTSILESQSTTTSILTEGDEAIADDEDNEAQLIKDWDSHAVFPGYLSWALWGHIPMPGTDPDYKSQQFQASSDTTGNNKNKKGRVASRAKKAKTEEVARRVDTERGDSKPVQAMWAYVHRSGKFYDNMEKQSQADFVRSCLKNRLEHADSMLQRVAPLVYANPDCLENKEMYKDWEPLQEYLEYMQEIKDVRAQMKRIGDAAMEELNRKTAAAAAAGRSNTPISAAGVSIPREVIALDQEEEEEKQDNDDEESSNDSLLTPVRNP